MPVIVVANPKGGVGKSTLATNLAGAHRAARGHAVMLGDVDRQQSSRTWLDTAMDAKHEHDRVRPPGRSGAARRPGVGTSDWITVTSSASTSSPTRPATTSGSTSIRRAPRPGPSARPSRTASSPCRCCPRCSPRAFAIADTRMGVNYGLNRVRFPAPVPVGSRLRGRFKLLAYEPIDGGAQLTVEVTMEREGSDKPVCIAESLARRYVYAARIPTLRQKRHEGPADRRPSADPRGAAERDPGPRRRRHAWSASTARAAAREALDADAGFDLVLLDLQLGDADGFDVLVELRAALSGAAGRRRLGVRPQQRRDPRDRPRRDGLRAQARQQRDAVRGAAHGHVGRHLRAADDAWAASDAAAPAPRATPCRRHAHVGTPACAATSRPSRRSPRSA